MKSLRVSLCFCCLALLAVPVQARQRAPRVPKPLNRQVRYQPYQGTDLAQISFQTSRREFRVGHPPYRKARFHVAEFVLVVEHLRKYRRPDIRAEIKLAPGRTKPTLTANKVFQGRLRDLLAEYRKLLAELSAVKAPRACREAHALYRSALADEIAVVESVIKRLFASQQIRDRELFCGDLKKQLGQRRPASLDKLCDSFVQDGNLAAFYPALITELTDARLDQALKLAEKAMAQVGVEYAIAAEEKADGPIE